MLNLGKQASRIKPLARPVYLNLFTFAFPVTAIVSILHRISGVLLLFMIPVFLGMLQDTLYYPWLTTGCSGRIIIWIGLSAFIYHLIAGIRHLCMDVGMAEGKSIARITSYIVFALTAVFSLMIGMHLC